MDLGSRLCFVHLQVQFPTLTLDAAIDCITKGKGLGPQKQRALTLDMEFKPSLALYVWQSFTKTPYALSAARYKDVANVWAIAAQVCSTQGCIATSMANSSRFLPDILDLDPVQTLSADRLLYQNPSESPQPFVMPQVEPVAQNLLLFAQLLAAIAAERSSMLATMTAAPSSTSEGKDLRSAIAIMLQGLTDGSCCTPVLLTDTADASQPLSKASQLVIMLRSTVLITKLVSLTYNVKAELLGHAEGPGPPISTPPISMQTLWYSMAAMTRSLLDTSLAESGAVGVRTLPASARAVLSLQPANEEEQRLCTVLIEHVVVTLRQCLKGPHAKMQSKHQKVACLQLWEVLLPIMDLGRVGPETKRLGNNCWVSVTQYFSLPPCFVLCCCTYTCCFTWQLLFSTALERQLAMSSMNHHHSDSPGRTQIGRQPGKPQSCLQRLLLLQVLCRWCYLSWIMKEKKPKLPASS